MADVMSFVTVLVFLALGIVFVAMTLTASHLIHRWFFGRKSSSEKLITYECGEDPVGDTRIKFNIRFYIIALVFLIFDVEVVLMLPWGVVFRNFPSRGLAFVEMLIFVAILLVGLAYVWAKGDLEWVKTVRKPESTPAVPGAIPPEPRTESD